jgi:hypothetical protein
MGNVSRLQTILALLESHLQTFFEGGAVRLFPSPAWPRLAQRLAEAMQTEIRTQAGGSILAPNVFTVIVPPNSEYALPENAGLLDELADIIRRTGEEAGYRFNAPPIVRAITDGGSTTQDIQVFTDFSPASSGDTSALRLLPSADDPSGNRHDPASSAPGKSSRAFLIVDGTRIVPLTGQGLTIGRRSDMTLVLEQAQVSRVHAQIRLVQGRYMIFDLESSGGTYVNGLRVTQCALHTGDVISLAGVKLVFGQESGRALDQTQELNLPEIE